jgi:prephenate dehydrogenase
MTNRQAVLEQLDTLDAQLDQIRRLLMEGDEEALREKLEGSRAARMAWHERFNS